MSHIGQSIKGYYVRRLVGEGGMGTVYRAEDPKIDKPPVAIKVLHQHYTKQKEVKARFKQEATLQSQLNHPNIISLYEYVEKDQECFIIMEFFTGKSLSTIIGKETGPLVEKRSVPIMLQILSGIGLAHEKGIIHRDIKPANILINRKDKVKITDFGIAKVVGNDQNMTSTGIKIGTQWYMSPEQIKGKNKEISFETDIYSIGVTFYEMLSGQLPFPYDNEYEIMNGHVNENPKPPSTHYPGIPEYLDNVVLKALSKDPKDRFKSCDEFARAINNPQQKSSSIKTNDSIKIYNDISTDKKETFKNKPPKDPPKINRGIFFSLIIIIIFFIVIISNDQSQNTSYQSNPTKKSSSTSNTVPKTKSSSTSNTLPKTNSQSKNNLSSLSWVNRSMSKSSLDAEREFKNKNYILALSHTKKVFKTFYDSKFTNNRELIEIMFQNRMLSMQSEFYLKDYIESIKHADSANYCIKILNKKNSSLPFYRFKGTALLELKRYSEASKLYTEALEYKESADFYFGRGSAYKKLNQWSSVFNDAKKAQNLVNNYEGSHLLLGSFYQNRGNKRKACNNYGKAKNIMNADQYTYLSQEELNFILNECNIW